MNLETLIGDAVLSPLAASVLPPGIGRRFRAGPAVATPPDAFDRKRRQLDAARLLAEISTPSVTGPLLLVTDADLCLADRPFVFGAADPIAGRAVASTFRLEGDAARLFSVLLHELAHLRRWEDCADPDCLLHSAATLAAIDRRGSAPCAACRRRRP